MKRSLFAIVIASCGTMESVNHSAVRYTNAEQHYSVDQPEGWSSSVDRGAVRFAPKDNKAEAKHTIVVRSALRPREVTEGKATTNDDLIAATARVLAALPRVKVEGPTPIESSSLPGVRFSATFVPIGMSVRYRRTHVTLFGKSHVYHVIYTSPDGEPVDEGVLTLMIATLEEEV